MNNWGKHEGMIVHRQEPFNAEPPRSLLAEGTPTTLDTFFVRNHGPVPDLGIDSWHLTVDGLVERPLELSLPRLMADFPRRDVVATLQCAGNRRAVLTEFSDTPGEQWGSGATSTTRWSGVALADVLREAGLYHEAEHIAFSAPDIAPEADPPQPFGGSVPRAKALGGEVLLAWSMDGRPLPPVHGAPLRAVVPGWIGARSVKWLTRITAQVHPSESYFQTTAYRSLPPGPSPAQQEGIPLGPVPLNCDVLHPDDEAHLPAGLTSVGGYAFAGERSVARVDVSADGGHTWTPAQLDPSPGRWAWRYWHTVLDLPPGSSVVRARAWDETGATHPSSPADVWNPKGYANNSQPAIRVLCR